MIWRLGDRQLDLGARVCIMGILNVTPDSFYDGGRYAEAGAAIERGLEMAEEGADIIDVGGESSRPPLYGEAHPVSVEEECARVVPVVEGLRRQAEVAISVDTTKAEVARRALEAGADIVNDISALRDDAGMGSVAAEFAAPVVLMHRRGTPSTMQKDTRYSDLLGEIRCFLESRLQAARAQGIEQVALDPGLGFGKSAEGNLALLRHLDCFADLGAPLLLGASRKSFIWKTLGLSKEESLEGSLAAAVLGVERGARIVRVHDVRPTCRAVRLVEAALRARSQREIPC